MFTTSDDGKYAFADIRLQYGKNSILKQLTFWYNNLTSTKFDIRYEPDGDYYYIDGTKYGIYCDDSINDIPVFNEDGLRLGTIFTVCHHMNEDETKQYILDVTKFEQKIIKFYNI